MKIINTEAKNVINTVKIEHDQGLSSRACRKREGELSGGECCPIGKRCEEDGEEEEEADEANGIIMGGFGTVASAAGVESAAAAVVGS